MSNVPPIWIAKARLLTPASREGETVLKVYTAALKWIVDNNYGGGCHDTSAAMYMVLRECGILADLCIGEVKTGDHFFDHSWVEVRGTIYDAAVCVPNPGGKTHPAVYASVDLQTGLASALVYGASSPTGYDDHTKFVVTDTIAEYASKARPGSVRLWDIAKAFGAGADLRINAGKISRKYGGVRRTERRSTLSE